MIVIPAIDVKDGKCVRLLRGDFDRSTVYGDDPVVMAERWAGEGAEWIHVVDLDGARAGRPVHLEMLRAMARRTDVRIEFGGGIRTIDDVRAVAASGAERLVLGTAALESPDLLQAAAEELPGRIYVALDARDGRVAVRGWTESSDVTVIDAARDCAERGAAGILFTDISRDGTREGVNVEATRALAESTTLPVIASGGVACLDDVRSVAAIEAAGVEALVIGRALYTGDVTLAEAIRVAGGA